MILFMALIIHPSTKDIKNYTSISHALGVPFQCFGILIRPLLHACDYLRGYCSIQALLSKRSEQELTNRLESTGMLIN